MKLNKQELLLLDKAKEASRKAYAPYSKYKVGAALLTINDTIYSGCNVENSSYSLSICAERNAIQKAISNGEKSFKTIAVYADSLKEFLPCGACRQVLSEFSHDVKIICANRNTCKVTSLDQLFPLAFRL